jgi:hypothetical protein
LTVSVDPKAADVYEQFRSEGSAKFIAALERIKGACDALDAANAAVSYSQVGKMAVQLYGGPKTQSIMNSPKHKAYIDARRRERLSSGARPTSAATPQTGGAYPATDLDYKTRRYIDDLRQRNTLLESAMRELKQQVLTSTEMRPLDLAAMISAGPQGDASMAVQQSQSPALPAEAKDALRQLLDDLALRVPGVESFKGKGIRLRTGEWLLPPDRFALLKSIAEG